MDFAPAYILKRGLFRIKEFLHHYYIDGTRFLFDKFIGFLENIDRSVAFKITLKNFFVPLYRDYSIIGRILGVIFRSIRLLFGAIIYSVLGIFFLLLILFWFLVPIILVALAFGGSAPK
jgi:hypothetical protein